MTVNLHTVVNFRILSTLEQAGLSNLIGEIIWKKKRTVMTPMQYNDKAPRDERTLKNVSISLSLYPFV